MEGCHSSQHPRAHEGHYLQHDRLDTKSPPDERQDEDASERHSFIPQKPSSPLLPHQGGKNTLHNTGFPNPHPPINRAAATAAVAAVGPEYYSISALEAPSTLQPEPASTADLADEAPIYVNRKQFHRILKRRKVRQTLEERLRLSTKARKPFLTESAQHIHPFMRPRDPGGHFLSSEETIDPKGKGPTEKSEPKESWKQLLDRRMTEFKQLLLRKMTEQDSESHPISSFENSFFNFAVDTIRDPLLHFPLDDAVGPSGATAQPQTESKASWPRDVDRESADDNVIESDSSRPSPAPADRRAEILDRVMRPFAVYLHRRLDELQIGVASTDSANEATSGALSSTIRRTAGSEIASTDKHSSSMKSSSSLLRKRHANETSKGSSNHEGSGDDDDGSDEHQDKRPRQDNDINILKQSDGKFACPFFKRRPYRYKDSRSCRGSSWSTVHRLKCDHLYKHHMLAIRCNRCGTAFLAQRQLAEHQRAVESCSVRTFDWDEGIDAEKKEKLQSRKRDPTGATEVDKWKRMYRIIFPDDNPADMPTPFYTFGQELIRSDRDMDSRGSAERFEEFLRYELLADVRSRLAVELEKELEPAEHRLRLRFLDVLRGSLENFLYSDTSSQGEQRNASTLESSPLSHEQTVLANTVDASALGHVGAIPRVDGHLTPPPEENEYAQDVPSQADVLPIVYSAQQGIAGPLPHFTDTNFTLLWQDLFGSEPPGLQENYLQNLFGDDDSWGFA